MQRSIQNSKFRWSASPQPTPTGDATYIALYRAWLARVSIASRLQRCASGRRGLHSQHLESLECFDCLMGLWMLAWPICSFTYASDSPC